MWQSINESLTDKEKKNWNEWRRSLWEKAQDLQVAAHQCPLRHCRFGDELSNSANALRGAVAQIPVFDAEAPSGSDGCIRPHSEKEKT